jgi:hypothetical protein
MKTSRAAALLGLCVLAAGAASRAGAEGSPQDWMKRILDPTKIGVTPFPGSTLNRKLTVDYLSKADPPKQIAVYMAPLDQIEKAAEYFEKILKVKPVVSGAGTEFALYRFMLSGGTGYPKEAEGLLVVISRSQWVDNKAQINLEYMPTQ